MIDLTQSRMEIDKVDKQIAELFEHRMKIARDVAEYKIQTGKKVFDKEREKVKLNTLKELAGNEFNRQAIQELFSQIMSISRKLQYGLISKEYGENTFQEIAQLHITEETKVVCFGVKGSYTEQAMEEYFGTDIKRVYAPTFKQVMEDIKDGHVDYGVLPIENTSTGGITDIYDLLVEFDNIIIGEHVVKVDHALLGLPGSSLDNIRTVYSHTQGLLQCSKFILSREGLKSVECISTADSAKKVLEEQDITQGAIASKKAANVYGLSVLQEKLNHEENNSTRFIVIARDKRYLKNSNKISICFELPHESGSLYNMLSHIIYNNLNMTKIESRPLEGKNFEYRFFVDFEGNIAEPAVKNALYGIQEEATRIRILGNYKTTSKIVL
ncbi:chorismate mutase [Anaerocolumna cellulosilytica]|uniref:Bifunctional chorismate mutase/prephenate dehydratase n=1 Tax=Anaerocolumna cellulosilytica TaxID=433286 RepID=A0A6S6R101_9FIRM|nr:prephenate dehydratase [Anaerocolumna cellulosilytica]MBB5196636.1 chorismate mutase/prephenate dehydratase [Anaerocolumna cellulosilytica]BCJ95736.1 chorismate mutase [Anaerocolumna cellulosilytica]